MYGRGRLSLKASHDSGLLPAHMLSCGSRTSVLILANSPCLSEKAVISASAGVAGQTTGEPWYALHPARPCHMTICKCCREPKQGNL